jgi:hypothetical protein
MFSLLFVSNVAVVKVGPLLVWRSLKNQASKMLSF